MHYMEEQRAVNVKIVDAINKNIGWCLYINVKGVSGKTFLLNRVLKAVCSIQGDGCVALYMANTGFASNLFIKVLIHDSRLKAPLEPDNFSTLVYFYPE